MAEKQVADSATLIIAADRVIDGSGDSPLEGGAVAIRENEVVDVGPSHQLRERYPTARLMEHRGCTILPGLVDSHVHLTFSAGSNLSEDLKSDSDSRMLLQATRNAREALLAGVTTVRDLGSRDKLGLDVRDAIADGVISGPRVLTSGRPITAVNGHLHLLGGVAQGIDEIKDLTRSLIAEGVDCIKVIATGGNSTPGSDPFTPAFAAREFETIVSLAEDAGLLVTAHARGVEGIRAVTNSGIHGIEHCRMEVPPGQWEFDEALAKQIARNGNTAAPTLAASYRAFQYKDSGRSVGIRAGAIPISTRLENARRLKECGVRVVVGTDAGASLCRLDEAVHLELELLVDAGWTPLEALEAGTRGSAFAIGRDRDLGTLAANKLADLVVVRGNPAREISDVRNVEHVIMNGAPVVEDGMITREKRPQPWLWPYNELREAW